MSDLELKEQKEMLTSLEKLKFPEKTLKKLYAMKDIKDGFLPIFQANNDLVALRTLSDLVNDAKADSNIRIHPEDYELYFIGLYCKETGELKSEVKFLGRALDYVKSRGQTNE